MSATKMPLGRPPTGEKRDSDDLFTVSVKLDAETLDQLKALEAPLPAVRGRRSVLLRRLIQDAFKRSKTK